MIKYIVISAVRFANFTNPSGWSDSDWSDITYGGVAYKACAYIDGLDEDSKAYADFNFDNEDQYNQWLSLDGHLMVCYQDGFVTQVLPYTIGAYSENTFVVDTLANAKIMLTTLGVNCFTLDNY